MSIKDIEKELEGLDAKQKNQIVKDTLSKIRALKKDMEEREDQALARAVDDGYKKGKRVSRETIMKTLKE